MVPKKCKVDYFHFRNSAMVKLSYITKILNTKLAQYIVVNRQNNIIQTLFR